MSERTITVSKDQKSDGVLLENEYGGVVVIPEDQIDAVMEDIKNLR